MADLCSDHQGTYIILPGESFSIVCLAGQETSCAMLCVCVCVCVCACVLRFMCITLYGAPFCFPSQKPLAVHLVLLVTAHNSKRDHLLLSAHMQTQTHKCTKSFKCSQ